MTELKISDMMNAFAKNRTERLIDSALIRELLRCNHIGIISNNAGAWDGSGSKRDLYEDIFRAINMLSDRTIEVITM